MDEDFEIMSRDGLIAEVKKLRQGVRATGTARRTSCAGIIRALGIVA
jgi:hypothetical protein